MSLPYYPWIGVIAGLAGSVAINTGNNLQSLGMQQLELEMIEEAHLAGKTEMPTAAEINPNQSKTWVMGTGIFITGSLLNFASYSLAPQSLLASLESVQFVTNVLFGKFMLGKEITDRMYLGTGLTVSGTVLAILFSSKQAATLNGVHDLIMLWANPAWIAYICFISALAIVLQILYQRYEMAAANGQPYPNSDNLMAVFYSTYSALFGSTSVVFAKLLAEFVSLMSEGKPVFDSWFFYVTFLAWLGFMAYWLVRLNNALALYDPLFIIPLLQANFIFFAIISGGIYFQEFNYMTGSMWAGFVSGIVVIFTGLYFLAPEKEEGDEDELLMGGETRQLPAKSTFELGEIYANQTNEEDEEEGKTNPVRRRSSYLPQDEDIDALVKGMYKNVRTAFEDAQTGKAHQLATKFFMGGTAHMNHHSNKMQIIKRRKEKELMALMGGKTAMTPAQVNKVKELMGQIKLVDQTIDLSTHLDTIVQPDGTLAPDDAASMKESILSFRENNKMRDSFMERRSTRMSLFRPSSATAGGGDAPRRSSTFFNMFNASSKNKDRSEGDMSDITMGSTSRRNTTDEDLDTNPNHRVTFNDDDTVSSSESMANNPRSMSRGSTDSDLGLINNAKLPEPTHAKKTAVEMTAI